MGIRFSIRVKPGSRHASVGGSWGDGDALIVAVDARAVEGRANEAVIAALAAALGVRRGAITIVVGQRGRDKIVEVDPAPPGLDAMIDQLRRSR